MTLYLVATPIGNLGDITFRAAEILKTVDTVACEDTRVTRNLLTHIGSKARTISVREANEREGSAHIIRLLEEGKDVAYCSDAGMPGISDPGAILVESVRNAGHTVTPIPGPNAAVTAVAVAGFHAERFLFIGFLPSKKSARLKELHELKSIPAALVFYESPHRMNDFLNDALEVLGPRKSVICRELTKLHEEIIPCTLADIRRDLWRGEITIVIEPPGEKEKSKLPDIEEWIRQQQGPIKEIAKEAADLFEISKKTAYLMALEIFGKK